MMNNQRTRINVCEVRKIINKIAKHGIPQIYSVIQKDGLSS